MIFETIVVTTDAAGETHITPFGIRYQNKQVLISPFMPSITLNNALATQSATVNFTDDVRIFAGALTQHKIWKLKPANAVSGYILEGALAHKELQLIEVKEDSIRPTLIFDVVHQVNHQPFQGFNRAQSAVVELAVLVSRLDMLPIEKIQHEMQYLQIAIDKTAGERELEAWGWLVEKVNEKILSEN